MSERQLVVGAAVVVGGRVLAALRAGLAAGGWELPGGKVEPGESPAAALVREIAEELGCAIEPIDWLPGASPISDALVLRVALARLVTGEPTPHEHEALRWLAADELDDVDWLAADRPFLPALRAHLQAGQEASTSRVRAVFFEEEHVHAAARQLREDGYQVHVAQERYAGEDDDEDHPWALTTDAPAFHLELLAEEFDAWLDVDAEAGSNAGQDAGPDAPGSIARPLDLPTAPRRHHRHPDGPVGGTQ